ncbi:hypothetical protein CJ030_MR0G005049 [Morella rubra]|uniref:Peptidase A2 domain-containing protein n=1 Tax=Morella rubra TaxID=262757 RepID=A0A6A1ULI4_9ROSI|nr:hypothetical protein CJ030_MR0G005048 [Morella rubra]KAB1201112.1 hypothetical protein CJ030_MR0G005049 [Morella rubra]
MRGEIRVISRVLAVGGSSKSSRKTYVRQLLVAKINSGSQHPASGEEKPITFTKKDIAGIEYPQDDTLVIDAMIGNYKIQRILIDTGSSADILYTTAYYQMKLGKEALRKEST